MRLMHGFPPAARSQVTLANWRTPPFNRWAFHHVREIVPSADIPNDPARVVALPSQPVDLAKLRIDPGSGEPFTFEGFLEETSTDGMVVLQRGKLVFERYANGMTAATPHILMSVSKSLLGLLVGALKLDPERRVTDLIPEISGTAYQGATIRNLLDMRAGVAFEEDYLATSGPIIEYRRATGWNPLEPGDAPSDLRSFYSYLKKPDGPHGGRYADLMSELLWQPVGAERSAYITVDRLGAPRCAGGMCTTVRDLGRVGQWIIQEGGSWIEDIERNGDPKAWAAGNFVEYFPGLPMRYRSKWYVLEGEAPMLFGLGIHGQYLFVDRRNRIVIAKASSQALPLDAARIGLTMRAVSQIRYFLTHA